MKFQIPTALSTRLARTALVAQKQNPKVLFYGGLVLMSGTVVSACRGTMRLESTLDDIRQDRADLDRIEEVFPGKYTNREIQSMNLHLTIRGLARVAKLYLPSIALGVAAVGCLTSSHNQLTRRNAGLSAALAATERALDSYRNRVRESYGEEKELDLWRGTKTENVPVLDDEGRETKSRRKIKTGGGHSPYARIWGKDTTDEWDPEESYNFAKLRHVQQWGTMQLERKGHLFLNEIFDELGLSRTSAGAVVGWLSKDEGGTDGFVDLGVMNRQDGEFLDFVTGREEHVMLDFNVDGEIWRKI